MHYRRTQGTETWIIVLVLLQGKSWGDEHSEEGLLPNPELLKFQLN